MCGHGIIGTITVAIEESLITPKHPGRLNLETPAGLVQATYVLSGKKVSSVKIINVPSFLYKKGLKGVCPLGEITVDVAYGGNFYAIVDPQQNYKGLSHYQAAQLIQWSPILRKSLNDRYIFSHPQDSNINGLSHILWTGETLSKESSARNAVFYGEKAIDRSPCGTGTSSRMAQWFAQGKLKEGARFVHESYIGSSFIGRVEKITTCGNFPAIIPSIEGWAKITGYNHIIIDTEDDPYAHGFQVI